MNFLKYCYLLYRHGDLTFNQNILTFYVISTFIFLQELYNGLKNLLDYEEDDIEEMFMQTFRICYKDAFGELVYHDLIDNGDQITVNHVNKRVCSS